MFKNPQHKLIDLHGMSVEQAELTVKYHLSVAFRGGDRKIRFVTGRGNHVNKKGKRGVLFAHFESWINDSKCSNVIQTFEKHDGYYEVYFKPTPNEELLQAFYKEFDQALKPDIDKFKLLAEQGDPAIQNLYAAALREGIGVTKNDKMAFRYDKLAAHAGNPNAMFHLAYCYLYGIGTRQNDLEANRWLTEADKAGVIEATVCLGDTYANGRGVKIDDEKAVLLYKRAAEGGNTRAMCHLGDAHTRGNLGLEKSMSRSHRWYLKAAELGNPIAEYNVGSQLINGAGVDKNESEAFKYFESSAEHGDPDAQYICGKSYFFGDHVAKNEAMGIDWLKLAAKNGSEAASTLLIEIDPKNANEYRAKAAEMGNLIAKFSKLSQGGKEVSDADFDEMVSEALQQASVMTTNDIMLLDDISRYFLIDHMILSNQKKLLKKAMFTLEKMKEQNDCYAIRRLINLGRNMKSCIKPKQEIVNLLQQGVEINDSKCMVILGYYYQLGIVVEMSEERAANLYEQAAHLNNPAAYLMLSQYQFSIAEFFNSSLINAILSILEKAVDLELQNDVTDNLASGIIDCYIPVSGIANEFQSIVRALTDEASMKKLIDFFETNVVPIIQKIVFNRLTLNEKSTRQGAKPVFKDALTLKKEGNSLAGKKQYRLALGKYDMAINVDPKIAEVWLNKGIMHKKLDEYSDALQAFNTALTLQPDYFKAKLNKAEVLKLLQRYDDALDIYNELPGFDQLISPCRK